MRGTEFIEQNREKWGSLESLNRSKGKKDPKELSELFIEVTNDLSYSQTKYTRRSIKVYLNNLSGSIHSKIYKGRRSFGKRFRRFWGDELPRQVYDSRKQFLFSFLIFAASVAIGVFSSMQDEEFASHILGDSYVNMTEEYIASGDPMKVYKTWRADRMFVFIAINNLYVSFLLFVLGAFFGVGTVMVLISNGVMVGTFQYFFIERGLFQESFLTIWMHGTPEILGIIVAGAAGLTLGRGLVTPGNFGRWQSFVISARKGIVIMIGLSPIILYAAFVEGFVARFTEMPDVLRLIFIVLAAVFMVYYFGIYPLMRFRGRDPSLEDRDKLPGFSR